MRIARRLSVIVMLALFTVATAPAGEPASPLVAAPYERVAASHPLDGPPIEPRAQVRSRQARVHPARASRDQAQRDRTMAWLLLLLNDQRGAR